MSERTRCRVCGVIDRVEGHEDCPGPPDNNPVPLLAAILGAAAQQRRKAASRWGR